MTLQKKPHLFLEMIIKAAETALVALEWMSECEKSTSMSMEINIEEKDVGSTLPS